MYFQLQPHPLNRLSSTFERHPQIRVKGVQETCHTPTSSQFLTLLFLCSASLIPKNYLEHLYIREDSAYMHSPRLAVPCIQTT